jgi:hypothetical protein
MILKISRTLKEGKYSGGPLKSRETELHDQSGQQAIFKEAWWCTTPQDRILWSLPPNSMAVNKSIN